MADNDPAADPTEIGLNAVQSLEAFARACARLRTGRSYADLGKAARPRPLPPATISNLLNAKGTPTRDTVITFLIACGLDDEARQPWLAAWERVATAHQPRPVGVVRVGDARPRLLGVHAAIQVAGTDGELPPYVPRDLDADLRAALTAAAAQGGFVLLIGGSSVGKTRALYEAVRAELREWWLLHPLDTPAIATYAEAPTPRTLVWLDELQRYLNHPVGLPAGTLRQLITARTVVVATLWPDEYHIRTARPPAGQADPNANDRDLLGFAQLIEVPETFSRAERGRGETLADTDQRIRIALDATDAGFTQVLAAGPALIHRWEHAPATDCYGKAVITAALDARRVGAHHVTRDFLETAAPAYLAPAQRATAPTDWLDRALTYATASVRGATACLIPVPAGMGSIAGYIPADYLHQHAQRIRRTTRLPDVVWHTLVEHHHPDDTFSLAKNAETRGRDVEAEVLYRRAADAGNESSALCLVNLLLDQGRLDHIFDVIGQYAIVTDWSGVFQSARDWLTKGWHTEAINILRNTADRNDLGRTVAEVRKDRIYEAMKAADRLVASGNIDELRRRTIAGDRIASYRLAAMLARQGNVDELLNEVAAGSPGAAKQLARLNGTLFELPHL